MGIDFTPTALRMQNLKFRPFVDPEKLRTKVVHLIIRPVAQLHNVRVSAVLWKNCEVYSTVQREVRTFEQVTMMPSAKRRCNTASL